MNNIIQNKTYKFNKLDYKSSPVRAIDFISNKYDVVHDELYNKALDKYLKEKYSTEEDIANFKKTHIFLEIKQPEYYIPSKVIIKELVYPYTVETIDLTQYWDNYQFNDEYRNKDEILLDEDSLKDGEIIYIDYVKGQAKLKSRYTGKEFWLDFKYLDENTKVNKDEYSLEKTFSYKIQNKIYGE